MSSIAVISSNSSFIQVKAQGAEHDEKKSFFAELADLEKSAYEISKKNQWRQTTAEACAENLDVKQAADIALQITDSDKRDETIGNIALRILELTCETLMPCLFVGRVLDLVDSISDTDAKDLVLEDIADLLIENKHPKFARHAVRKISVSSIQKKYSTKCVKSLGELLRPERRIPKTAVEKSQN
jgi:hypothetical protein